MAMEQYKRELINKINLQIKQQETYQKQNLATIERFKKNNKTKFTCDKIVSLNKTVEESVNKLKDLKKELILIRRGDKDDEIRQSIHDSYTQSKQRTQENLQKKKERKEERQKKKEQYNTYCKDNRKAWRKERQKYRDSKRGYGYYCYLISSIPHYLEENLQTMPHNKGYIWKGVWLFGKLPKEPGKPCVMFDRKNRNLLLIHEFTPYETKIWEKRGKNRKVLVKHEYRKKQNFNL